MEENLTRTFDDPESVPGAQIDGRSRFSYLLLTSPGQQWPLFRQRDVGSSMVPEEGWVGIQEVSAHLRVAKGVDRRWVESTGFPARRVGCLFRFKLSEVDEWGNCQRRE